MADTATSAARPAEPVPVDVDQHPAFAWLQARQKPFGIAIVVILVIGIVAWYVVESGRRKQVQAADALDKARSAMETGNYPQASQEFQRVAQNYAGSDAAYEATLALNQVRMLSGQSQLAVDELKKFVASNPPASFKSAALSHLGMALENTGKTAEAATAYAQAADVATEDYRKIDALLNAARANRVVGKDKEAVQILEGVVRKYKETEAGVVEAKVRLAELTGGRT